MSQVREEHRNRRRQVRRVAEPRTSGTLSVTTVNPDVLHGWGVRPYDWQFGVSLQQEVLPRVSVDVGYNRRSWGNHFFTDNRAIGPEDFDVATITAPTQSEPARRRRLSVTFVTRNSR